MIHIIHLLVCIISVEVLIQLNFLSLLDSILKVARKVTHAILQNNISDHWKEKVFPLYALRIMRYSLQILLIQFLILSLFLITNFFVNDFLELTLSLIGIMESLVFAIGYVYIRKLSIK